jgi:hypothetical protein
MPEDERPQPPPEPTLAEPHEQEEAEPLPNLGDEPTFITCQMGWL